MLWFAMATDPATERQAPTWYVGKAEEFGQARGWLQVRSDAERPVVGPHSDPHGDVLVRPVGHNGLPRFILFNLYVDTSEFPKIRKKK